MAPGVGDLHLWYPGHRVKVYHRGKFATCWVVTLAKWISGRYRVQVGACNRSGISSPMKREARQPVREALVSRAISGVLDTSTFAAIAAAADTRTLRITCELSRASVSIPFRVSTQDPTSSRPARSSRSTIACLIRALNCFRSPNDFLTAKSKRARLGSSSASSHPVIIRNACVSTLPGIWSAFGRGRPVSSPVPVASYAALPGPSELDFRRSMCYREPVPESH